MYELYWQLEKRPFEHAANAQEVFPAASQRGALLKLRYVLENRRGVAVLAGESGLGKSLLAQTLLAELDSSFAPKIHVVFPHMPPDQLLTYLADQLTGQRTPLTDTIQRSVQRIERTLLDQFQAGKHPVIVIDEAHLIREAGTLECMRLLTNFQQEGQPLASILLVGQTGLVLAVRRLPALDERVAVTCVLTRLTASESAGYVQHRLSLAGAKRLIFESSAVEAIFELTHGIPRRINRLCDLALLVGYGEELRTLSRSHIESIHAELVGTAAAA